jgi:flagellar L-ring protein precursor FlgH
MRSMLWTLFIAAAGGIAAPGHADSLYDEAKFQTLTADRRASRPGDSLTVLVFETASATASADTSTEGSSSLNLGLKTMSKDKSARVTLSDDFNGKGTIQRSGKVAAQITVTVQSVEPNGDLVVAGRQLIEVNDEQQHIVLSGKVRPIDIAENNTVVSTRLADANISYVGDGILAEKQRPGILSRILHWLRLL